MTGVYDNYIHPEKFWEWCGRLLHFFFVFYLTWIYMMCVLVYIKSQKIVCIVHFVLSVCLLTYLIPVSRIWKKVLYENLLLKFKHLGMKIICGGIYIFSVLTVVLKLRIRMYCRYNNLWRFLCRNHNKTKWLKVFLHSELFSSLPEGTIQMRLTIFLRIGRNRKPFSVKRLKTQMLKILAKKGKY